MRACGTCHHVQKPAGSPGRHQVGSGLGGLAALRWGLEQPRPAAGSCAGALSVELHGRHRGGGGGAWCSVGCWLHARACLPAVFYNVNSGLFLNKHALLFTVFPFVTTDDII